MKYKLRYYAFRFFNAKHGALVKWLLLACTYCFCLFFRVPKPIFTQLRSDIRSDDFKLVIRRISWLLSLSWLGKLAIDDRYFDFSIGLSVDSARATYRLVEKKANERSFLDQIKLAQLASSVLEAQVAPGQERSLGELQHQEFDEKYSDHLERARALLKSAVSADNAGNLTSRVNTAKTDAPNNAANKANLMQKHAENIFGEFLALFDNMDFDFFVISGTFLGLIRDKNFIAHDYDIDFGMFEQDYTPEIIEILENSGCYKTPKLDYPCFRYATTSEIRYKRTACPALIKLNHSDGVQIDIFTHFLDGDVYWHGSSLHRWDNKVFTLTSRKFLNYEVMSPSDYDLYLTENYGDWRTPVKDFNCSTGTPNVVISDSPKTICYFLKREYFSDLV